MGIKTRITELLKIEHPIVCGGMTGVGTPELAAAVSNAGGLGVIAAHNAGSPQALVGWIERCKKLTSKPFAVNMTILPTMGPPPPYAEYARVIIESGVGIVETAGSSPKELTPLFKRAGLIVIHKCVTIRHALSAQRLGVDIISLDHMECAGHPGEGDIGGLVLQARGAEELKVPYLASGGIANGRQLAACLALGAEGVNCGTLFASCTESNWPDTYKNAICAADENQTALIFRPLANTARVFKNRVAREVVAIEKEKGKDLEFGDVAHLVAGKRGREAEKQGDPDGGIWSAGQSIGLIHSVVSVQQAISTMVADAEKVIRATQRLVVSSPKL